MDINSLNFSGDLLDVLRTDSDNLLDIDGLQSFLDDLNEEEHPMFGVSHGMVTTKPHPESMYPSTSDQTAIASASGQVGMKAATASAARAMPLSDDAEDDESRSERKKRSRNKEQMEHNRVAQKNYRERKKMENKELQHAVDLLTAELAAMKALEVRAAELEAHNSQLVKQVVVQREHIQHLEGKVSEQQNVIATQTEQLTGQLTLLTSQQKMILDQHQKLQLQEEIMNNLKDMIRGSVEAAWSQVSAGTPTDPQVVCRKMHQAVRSALMGAKDVEGLQETLAQLPEHVVVEICKNILCACRDMLPELAQKLGHGQCGQAIQCGQAVQCG